jgi:archaemetzincin
LGTPLRRNDTEASSNGRTADFGSAYEGSNPSASTSPGKPANLRAEVRPLRRPPRLLLVALGGVGERLRSGVRAALHEVLHLDADLGPVLERPGYAFNEARGQYHTAAILRRLTSLRTGSDQAPVLALADVDLFLPDATYVLGDADRDAGTALVSTARLATRDLPRLLTRARVEAIHEAGHLLGLGHCADYRCAMYLSRELVEVDRKGPGLCHGCRTALGLEH